MSSRYEQQFEEIAQKRALAESEGDLNDKRSLLRNFDHGIRFAAALPITLCIEKKFDCYERFLYKSHFFKIKGKLSVVTSHWRKRSQRDSRLCQPATLLKFTNNASIKSSGFKARWSNANRPSKAMTRRLKRMPHNCTVMFFKLFENPAKYTFYLRVQETFGKYKIIGPKRKHKLESSIVKRTKKVEELAKIQAELERLEVKNFQ